MNSQPPIVKLESVTKIFRQGKTDVRALDNVSLNIDRGQFVAIMGASGSGKSTLLHLVAGLASPTSGQITLLGERIGGAVAFFYLTVFPSR